MGSFQGTRAKAERAVRRLKQNNQARVGLKGASGFLGVGKSRGGEGNVELKMSRKKFQIKKRCSPPERKGFQRDWQGEGECLGDWIWGLFWK